MTGLLVEHIVEFPIRKPMGLLTQSTGVPQVITSIIGNPNGSGQSMGNTALRRFQRHAAGFNLQCPAQAGSPTGISLPRFIMASPSTCLSQIATAA
jgi:hypothetical protein